VPTVWDLAEVGKVLLLTRGSAVSSSLLACRVRNRLTVGGLSASLGRALMLMVFAADKRTLGHLCGLAALLWSFVQALRSLPLLQHRHMLIVVIPLE